VPGYGGLRFRHGARLATANQIVLLINQPNQAAPQHGVIIHYQDARSLR